ncbi:hypothetical protein BDY24DRAFT_355430 [Mrakia frigida]|uniref:mismatch repair protein MLH3 n=1 Tax=Mrakia frigida TaxID=29902 RepID=UPI003FCC02CE
MSSFLPSIAPLPQPTVSTLRSSTIITSLPQALTELVQNALDAQARHIAVYLDLERWGMRVEDDGTGMRREAVEAIGSGERYGTSKTSTHSSLALHSTFGFRGEALASLASVAYLEVSSSTKESPASWSISIKGSKPITSGPSRTYKRLKPGTTVVVKDLFFNLPIRRLSHSSASSTIQTARKLLETASMLFPEVAFTLIDLEKEKEPSGGKIWGVGKTSSILSRFSDIHGIALVHSVTELDVLEAGKSEGEGMKVEGFVSLQGGHSRAYQYLYVNRHPLAWCELHKAIETRFERSGFGRAVFTDASPGSPSRSRRSPRKLDRKPIYVLNLLVPPKKLDRNLEPAKAAVQFEEWSAVTTLLISAVDQFLNKHGLSIAPPGSTSKKQSRLRDGDAGSPSPSPLRKKPRRVEEVREDTAFVADPSLGEEAELKRWQDPSTKEVFLIDSRTGHSFPALTKRTSGRNEDDVEDVEEEEEEPGGWTKRMSLKREGESCGTEKKEVPSWLESTLKDWTNPTFASRLEPSIPSLPLQQQTPTSYNQSSANTQPFASSSSRNPFQQPISAFKAATTHFANNSYSSLDPTSTSQFTKSSLKAARAVAQIDRKFIACVLPPDQSSSRKRKKGTEGGGTLVLIDQHAADERIRVERFLKQLGEGFLSSSDDDDRGIPLHPTPSLLLLLTPTEHSHLLSNPSLLLAFKKWGIHLRLPATNRANSNPKSSTSPVQIHIDFVPALLAERLEGKKTKGEVESGIGREAPREMVELVKGYLERLVGESGELEGVLNASRKRTRKGVEGEGEGFEWLGALRWCPREILDLVNSKACRGAIMFNDPLKPQQCEKLIKDLSETVFPFQCAHGRPSVVPLVNLDDFVKSQETRPLRRNKLDWEGLGLDA